MCKFRLAFQGKCKNEADESGYCEEHKDVKCNCCHEQATRQCEASVGVCCGTPLCDNCEHVGFLGHRSKEKTE